MMTLLQVLFIYILGLYVFLPHSKIYNSGEQYKGHSDKSTNANVILDHEVTFEESYAAFVELMNTTCRTWTKLNRRDSFSLPSNLLPDDFDDAPSYCTGYCKGVDKEYCDYKILNDHCCCDHKYQEAMNWFPHRCYVSSETCRIYAENCEVYEITRECCCKVPMKKALMDFYSRQLANNIKMIGNEPFIFMILFIAVVQLVLLLSG